MRTQEVALNIQVILNGAAEHSLPDHYRWEQCREIQDQFKQKSKYLEGAERVEIFHNLFCNQEETGGY